MELELFEADWNNIFHGLEVLVDYYNRTRTAEARDGTQSASGLISGSVDDSRISSAPNAADRAAADGTSVSSKKSNRRHSMV